MKIGVFSNTIGGASVEEVAERTRAAGVEVVQLRTDWAGLDLEESAVDRARVRQAYERTGVTIAALAAYTNLLDPNRERRSANQRRFERFIHLAPELGTRVVVTECGSYDPHDSWSDHPHNHTPEAWAELVEVTTRVTALCERAGMLLAYEPYVNSVVDSAGAAHRLSNEVGSPALAFVFDPAGLVTPATLPHNRAVTAEALDTLRGRIALAHADDVRYVDGEAQWRPLGWGDLDAEAALHGLASVGFDGALIVEHLTESLVPEALAFCRDRLSHAPTPAR